MKIINIDKTNITFIPQTLEDLWTIKTVVDNNDVISGQSQRRQRQDDNKDSQRKPVFVSIKVDKFNFSQELNSLRFTGVVVDSKPQELAPLGEHHTLEVILNQKYTLEKEHLYQHQIDLIKTSSSTLNSNIILIVLDDEKAICYELTNVGVNEIASIDSGKTGKRYNTNYDVKDYFEEIYSVISSYDCQFIIAGPGHIKSKLNEFLKSKLKKINILEISIQNTSKSSINELFTKKEVARFFENSIIYKEQQLFNTFLEYLGKDNGKVAYGIKEIEQAIDLGAIEYILISETLWKEKLNEIQELIKKAEKLRSKIHIVDNDHEISKSLKSFSGIVSVLRFKIE